MVGYVARGKKMSKLGGLLLGFCLFIFPAIGQAERRPADAPTYQRLLQALEDGQPGAAAEALRAAEKGSLPILNEVLRWQAARLQDAPLNFNQYQEVLARHPDWPGRGAVRLEAEKRLPPNLPLRELAAFFAEGPPLTAQGTLAYARSLGGQEGRELIRQFWRTGAMSTTEQASFLGTHREVISNDDVIARARHLGWNGQFAQARQLALPSGYHAVLAARQALQDDSGNPDALLRKVPSAFLADPGLIFDRADRRAKKERYAEAAELIEKAVPDEHLYASRWGNLRERVARQLLARGQASLAYRVASRHGIQPDAGAAYTETEWLAGWLALEHLAPAKPTVARDHFKSAFDASKSINSRSKAAYWLGQALTEAGQVKEGQSWFSLAAKRYPSTFYGQAAALAAYGATNMSPLPSPTVSEEVADEFMGRKSIRAILALDNIGADRTALRFARSAMENFTTAAEFTLMARVGQQIGRPDISVFGAKIGGREGFTVGAIGYPTLPSRYRTITSQLEPALTHGLIWQESGFNPMARSGAGAMGYMQLMPTTAVYTAKMLGLSASFGRSALENPMDNLKLGTAYFRYVLDKLDGYVPEAIMGYNAGPGRPVRWRNMHGDPFCRPNNDPSFHKAINGIEAAMFSETRDYVKYVLAAEQVYRPILANGKVPLSLGERLATECRGERSATSALSLNPG